LFCINLLSVNLRWMCFIFWIRLCFYCIHVVLQNNDIIIRAPQILGVTVFLVQNLLYLRWIMHAYLNIIMNSQSCYSFVTRIQKQSIMKTANPNGNSSGNGTTFEKYWCWTMYIFNVMWHICYVIYTIM
jgi:hypothetical protein